MMADQDQYKTQIEDYRNLKPYYDLVFENMAQLSSFSFSREYQKMTDALRELITNAPSYIEFEWEIKDPKDDKKSEKKVMQALDILDLIEEEYGKLFQDDFKGDLNKDRQDKLEEARDQYLKFSRILRIKINVSLSERGFLPRTDKIRQKTQSNKTKGASV